MKNIFILLFLTFSLGIFSQIEDPLKWATSVEKISDTDVDSFLHSLNIPAEEKIIVLVARIQKEKRHEDAIEALAILHKKYFSKKVHLLNE